MRIASAYLGSTSVSSILVGGQDLLAAIIPDFTFDPIPAVFAARNIIIGGASIMDSSFGGTTNGNANGRFRNYVRTAGWSATTEVKKYAQAGDRIADLEVRYAQAQTDLAADVGFNLYAFHVGGNDVSAYRPFPLAPTDEARFRSDYISLIDSLPSADIKVPVALTKRLYGKDEAAYPVGPPANPSKPYVIHGDPSTDQFGSKPFNEGPIRDILADKAPDWRGADGLPFVNPYELVNRFPVLTYDGVHGYESTIATFILSRIAARGAGVAKTASRAGTSILYQCTARMGYFEVNAGYNRILWNSSDPREYTRLFGASCITGGLVATPDGRGFDPWIECAMFGGRGSVPARASNSLSRVPDTRFHAVPDLFANGYYVASPEVGGLSWSGLTPGDTLTLTAMGQQDSSTNGASYRLKDSAGTEFQRISINNGTDQASNQGTFDPITVPADGTVFLEMQRPSGGSGAYLHGVILDFT